MEKSEIYIGREVGKDGYTIDDQYVLVGRKHARITRTTDGFYIEDLNSANGVFVNGKPVTRKKINDSDKVTLGGADYYELNIAKVLTLLPMPDEEFQSKFLQLKQVYDTYQKEKVRIQSESQGKMILKRSLPMALPGTIMFFVPFFFDTSNPQVSAVIQRLGGVFMVIAVVLGSIWASKSMAKVPERLNRLNQQFLIDYVCPDCGYEFGDHPWENIRRQGKCKGCKREFNAD